MDAVKLGYSFLYKFSTVTASSSGGDGHIKVAFYNKKYHAGLEVSLD